MKITLAQAFDLLENCSAVVMDDNTVIYPNLLDLEGKEDNEFVNFSWTNGEGYDHYVACNEGENKTVEINGSLMTLVDNDTDELDLTLLAPMDIKNYIK